MSDNFYANYPVQGGGGVTSLNTLTGALTLAAGSNITITPSGGNTLTIASINPGGTVTSVGLVDSTGIFNVTGSPVTSSGSLTLATLKSQAANTFLSAPDGTLGAPTFRAILATDVPTLNQNTTGTAANITATSNSTLVTLSALSLPYSQITGAPGGTVTTVSVASANGFAGTSSGGATPALTLSTTVSGILFGNGTSIAAAIAANFPTLNQNTSGSAASLSATLVATSGGTGTSTYATGDTLYASATNTLSKLTIGSTGNVLTVAAGIPAWTAASSAGAFSYPTTGSAYGGTNGSRSFSGTDNTVVGQSAGVSLAAGSDNTFYGFNAANAATSLNKSTIIGSNTVVNGATDGSVAIGYGSTTNGASVVVGQSAAATTGNGGVSIGNASNHSGGGISIGQSAAAQGGSLALGFHASSSAASSVAIGGYISVATNQFCFAVGDNTNNAALYNPTSAAHQITFGVPGFALSDMYLGNGAVAVAAPTAVTIRPTAASGSNTAGANLSLIAGNGTGTGGSGSIIFQTAPVAGSSSTANVLATALTLAPSGAATFLNTVNATTFVGALTGTASGNIANTLTTTTGDVIYASSANTPARLGIGSTGAVLTVAGGIPSWVTPVVPPYAFVSKTTSYALVNTDNIVGFDTTGGSATATLPTAVGITGHVFIIFKASSDTNTVTINTTSAQTFGGGRASGSIVLRYGTDIVSLTSDGNNWIILDINETEIVKAVSGSVAFSGITAGNYAPLTTNSVSLTPGKWRVYGQFFVSAGTGTGISLGTGSGFYAANGANTASPPTALTGIVGQITAADTQTAFEVPNLTNSRALVYSIVATFITTITQSVFVVPNLDFTTAGSAVATAAIMAERIF